MSRRRRYTSLRALMDAKGWNADELARKSRVSEATIFRCLAGGHEPRDLTVLALASALGVTEDQCREACRRGWRS